MSGIQILTSFFEDQVMQAVSLSDQLKNELENADSTEAKLTVSQKLDQAQSYLEITTRIKELFDANQLTEKRLRDALQNLRGRSNG